MADEPFDLYSDAFTITLTPFGANLTFNVREPHPAQARVPEQTTLGTIRMSIEHLKTIIMLARRQVLQIERETGVKFEVSSNVLNQLGVSMEDWEALWRPALE